MTGMQKQKWSSTKSLAKLHTKQLMLFASPWLNIASDT